MKNEELLKGQSIPHDSASKHVSGFAQYTDDISEPINTLHGAIGWSEKAHAKIKKIDLSDFKFCFVSAFKICGAIGPTAPVSNADFKKFFLSIFLCFKIIMQRLGSLPTCGI